MPYWSSSKVGAVPQTQGQAKGKQGIYRKGITLSDLKRQTAIRLAKEQQLKGEPKGSHDTRPDAQRTSEPRRHPAVSPPPYGHSGAHMMQQYPDERQYQPHSNYHPYSSRGTFGAPPMAQPPVAIVSTYAYYHDQENNHRSAPHHSHSSSSMSEANGKPKLPHGLTVYELKEMTKARLQAEASEQTRDISTPEPFVPLHTREQDPRERSGHGFVPPSQQGYGRNVRSPPLVDTPSQPHESWSHDSRNDVWESGSVSTSASEYLGSEKGHSFYDDSGYGNRGRSFSANNVSAQDMIRDAPSPSIMQQSQPFYDGLVIPNRRRAATLSPRAGLTHLDEDRPLIGAPSIPVTSSISTPSKLDPRGASSPFDQGLVLDGMGPNRARTSSAVSLPPMSHTAEEFGSDSRLSRFGSLPEEDSGVTGLSEVFRKFELSSELPYGQENRTRASTWSETSSMNDVFGPGLISGNKSSMSNDLAYLLKLSGAEEAEAQSNRWL